MSMNDEIVDRWPTEEQDREVLAKLRKHGPIDRDELAWYVRLPRTTLFHVLDRLRSRGLIHVYAEQRLVRGRPKTLYKAKPRDIRVIDIVRDVIYKK